MSVIASFAPSKCMPRLPFWYFTHFRFEAMSALGYFTPFSAPKILPER